MCIIESNFTTIISTQSNSKKDGCTILSTTQNSTKTGPGQTQNQITRYQRLLQVINHNLTKYKAITCQMEMVLLHYPSQILIKTSIQRYGLSLRQHLGTRRASTSNHSAHPWPQSLNPTPYEIFSLPKTFTKKELKSKFNQLAKIYHPDTSSDEIPLTNDGKESTKDLKNERFKKVLLAYSILKDQRKKSIYDQFGSGWDNDSRYHHDPVYPTHRSYEQAGYKTHFNTSDQRYWNAGTWEDHYRQHEHPIDPVADALFKRNFIIGIFTFIVITCSLQFMGASYITTQEGERRLRIDTKCKADLNRVYDNYGYGDDRLSRIRRFLLFRRLFSFGTPDEERQGHLEDEELMKTFLKK